MDFHTNLRTLINEKTLTQKTIAENFNTTQQTISRWLNGKNEPDISTLIKLADYFDCSIDYLVGRENDFGIISGADILSSEEKELLASFRKLDGENKQRVIGYCYARGI